jgi:DNA-3-methyladenine glycosylase
MECRMTRNTLDRQFYLRDPVVVAQQLLGMLLVSTVDHKKTSGIIVETEAYLAAGDPACHAYRGPTRKNRTMFGPAGFAYVYPIHAKYCFNVVTEEIGTPSAVLIRALQPLCGEKIMAARRGQSITGLLCSGPARICQALAIDQSTNGHDLTRRRTVWIQQPEATHDRALTPIVCTRRIGVTAGKTRRLRFLYQGHPFASGPRSMRSGRCISASTSAAANQRSDRSQDHAQ